VCVCVCNLYNNGVEREKRGKEDEAKEDELK